MEKTILSAAIAHLAVKRPNRKEGLKDPTDGPLDGLPTIRPLKRKLERPGVFGAPNCEAFSENGYNMRTVRKLLLTGT